MLEFNSCPITGLPIKRVTSNKTYFEYNIDLSNGTKTLCLCTKCFSQPNSLTYLEKHKRTLHSFLLNNKDFIYEKVDANGFKVSREPINILHFNDIKSTIEQQTYPRNPIDKIDNLFLGLGELNKNIGDFAIIDTQYRTEFFLKYYFQDRPELVLYLKTLQEKKLLTLNNLSGVEIQFSLTYQGLLKFIELKEEGDNSNRCFVAMSFDLDDTTIFDEAILPACKKYNFEAIRVDRQHASNEQTINDLIIAEIKKSKFIIADFTKQKNGVYFEAGYGLGRGKKVIYTCRKDHFNNLHFDVNHFPVLVYENTEELLEMLGNKIEAFILD